MDLPFYAADFFGNRMLIAIIGIVHVWINHAFAVGMAPLITGLEWWAHRKGRKDLDDLARKILFVSFIVTTTVGALTGVAIWLSTSIGNPYAIASLLRVFYWAWFSEWIVFVSEVILIMGYFLTWKTMTGDRKSAHIRIGIALSVMSWLTMGVIVAVLGFMMNPGAWLEESSFLAGVMNPIYLPQLLFRTPVALAMAGSVALALTLAFTDKKTELRGDAVRIFSGWTLFWLVPTLIGGLAYYQAIPNGMLGNLPVAFGTQAFANRFALLVQASFAAVALVAVIGAWGVLKPHSINAVAWIVPVLIFSGLMGYFERAREFIRKPYVIGYYMYSNSIRVGDVPYLLKTGVLPHSAWATHKQVTEENKVDAGRDVYRILCSRCHTLNGVNSMTFNFGRLYPGQKTWDPAAIDQYLKNIHGARAYMPPFIGTVQERAALAAYLATLATRRDILPPISAPVSSSTSGN
jgi:cytochrome c2